MKSISVLLATYNSSLYLRAQLDSLFSQTNQDFKLFIRDDNSTDCTLEILQEYQKRYLGRVYIIDNQGRSLRAYNNFVELLSNVNSDYYMFCDHDDIWLPNKIQISLNRMLELESKNPNTPIVVHTDMKVVDQNLNVICDSFWKYSNLLPDHTKFEEMVLCNSANGCAMMFNDKAKTVALPNVSFATMHDMLVNQSVAASNGIISAIKIPAVLYRQHIDNVVGAKKRDLKYYVHKIKNIQFLLKDNVLCYKNANRIRPISIMSFLFTKIKIFIFKRTVRYEKYE